MSAILTLPTNAAAANLTALFNIQPVNPRQISSSERQKYAWQVATLPIAFATMCLGRGDDEGAPDYAERSLEDRRGWLAYRLVERMKL